jgi:hypothetical protein
MGRWTTRLTRTHRHRVREHRDRLDRVGRPAVAARRRGRAITARPRTDRSVRVPPSGAGAPPRAGTARRRSTAAACSPRWRWRSASASPGPRSHPARCRPGGWCPPSLGRCQRWAWRRLAGGSCSAAGSIRPAAWCGRRSGRPGSVRWRSRSNWTGWQRATSATGTRRRRRTRRTGCSRRSSTPARGRGARWPWWRPTGWCGSGGTATPRWPNCSMRCRSCRATATARPRWGRPRPLWRPGRV